MWNRMLSSRKHLTMRTAILDLGTNTFNLFIGEKDDTGKIHILFSNQLPVKIGRGGINQFTIKEDAWQRGLDALKEHAETIREYDVETVKGFATSAIRGATNGKDFISAIRDQTGFHIEVIDGNREAELVYTGVKNAIDLAKNPVLILDIGGGSNEFIIADKSRIFWKKSYLLGMARIIEKFNLEDPVTNSNIDELENYFEKELADLFREIGTYHPMVLIGSAGTFDTFVSMINAEDGLIEDKYTVPSHCIPLERYGKLHDRLLHSTTSERLKMKGLPEMRVEMIVPATIFVNFIIRKCNISTFIQSTFSLKEGAFFETLENIKE